MNLRPIFIYFFEKPRFEAEIAGFFKNNMPPYLNGAKIAL